MPGSGERIDDPGRVEGNDKAEAPGAGLPQLLGEFQAFGNAAPAKVTLNQGVAKSLGLSDRPIVIQQINKALGRFPAHYKLRHGSKSDARSIRRSSSSHNPGLESREFLRPPACRTRVLYFSLIWPRALSIATS
ncbi:hypothetical protein [Mesorhizobium sp. URHB0026]